MPSIAGSFGRCSGPLAITTKRARIASPRLVDTIHRAAPSSQRISVTSVWKQALRYRSKCSPMVRLWARISGAWVYFSFGT